MHANKGQTTDAQTSRSGSVSVDGCCGGPAPAGTSACCAKDAAVKSTGGAGCGCAAPSKANEETKAACCT